MSVQLPPNGHSSISSKYAQGDVLFYFGILSSGSNATTKERERMRVVATLQQHTQTHTQTLTIKVSRNSQQLIDLILLHTSFLDQIAVTIKDIVRPTVRGFRNELQFLGQVSHGLWIIFLQNR